MKILLDVMGGDYAPVEFIKGAISVIDELDDDTNIILLGQEQLIKEKINEIYKKDLKDISSRISIINCTEVISNHDAPTDAIKNKKDSSMCVAFKMLKENEADALVSAGSTGALMAGGLLKVGRIKGIDRPALCPMLPTMDRKGVILLDVGANTNCKPINLVQFAQMGSLYANKVLNFENPPVGLLNIGDEAEKGNLLTKESYELLKQQEDINFIGNVEARYMFDGHVRVVVCDGFSGNVALKTAEGIGKTVKTILETELTSSGVRKIGAGILKASGAIDAIKGVLDYHEYGGALLLGIEKPIIKGHGSSKEKDVKIVIKQAEKFVKSQVVEAIKENLAKEKLTD